MANNLIFPIGFDLQNAVEKAGQDWDKTYAKRLETYLAKRPIKVKLNFENLNDVKTRLAQLKIEPITPETKTSIKELARELQVLAKALEQVQKYSKNPAQLGQQNFRNDVQLEKLRQANERLEIQKRRVALAEQKHAEALNRTTKASREASAAIQAQDGYLSRLIKRTLAYASFNAIGTFLTRVREVTAQFELQRVSLGAIIQDQERANALFSEIKSFALKSPVSILDLTKYTKQLAAYKFETEELFDWTKRLTDISVGLGVSMDRVVLAAGQIRATGHLRSSEIRQLTEMGVPIVEELAAKLTQMNGELVTSADVLKLVEKRAISWGQVKEVFEDMTSAGGMFYQMQEKQGNTLYGLWAKLGDAASVMYEQIGNTESVNNAMKSSIQLLTDLMRNWRQVGQAIGIGLGGLVVAKGIKTFKGWQSNIDKAKIAANEQYIASSNAYRAAIKSEQAARATATAEEYRAIAAKTASAEASYNAARAEYLAARNTTIWSKAWGKLKAAFLGNWVTLLLMGVAAIATSIYNAYEKANRLKKALAELKDDSLVEADKSAFNFELLAKKAVEAADGSKEQREALQELQNTYKNIIPLQELSIEKLKELRGNYEAYTKAIRENIAVLSQQKQMDLVVEEYGKTILEAERRLKKEAKGVKITLFETDADGKTIERQVKLSNDQIDKYVAGVKYFASNTNKAQHEIRQMSFRLFVGLPENSKKAVEAFNYFDGANSSLVNKIRKQDVELENIQNSMSMYTASMGIFGDRWKQVADNIAKTPITGKAGSYLASRQKDLATINEYISALKDNFAAANIEWKESYATMVQSVGSETAELSTIDFAALKEAARKEGGDYAITLGNAIAEAEKGYNKLVPSDDIVNSLNRKLKSITLNTGASMDVMKKYLISGNDNIKDKLKSLTDSFDELTEKIYKFEQYNAKIAKGEIIGNVIPKEQIDALKEESKALGLFIELLQALFAPKETGGRGGKSDPRLQNLKEEISLTKKLYDEYHKLEKQIGATKAAEKIQQIYSNTIKTLQDRAAKYGFEFELPFTDENLKSNMQHFIDKMKELQKLRDKKGKPLFPNIGKEIDEAVAQLEDVDLNSLQKALEKKLKELSDRISRTKTAKEFYEKILRLTRNEGLAFQATFSVYGKDTLDTFTDEVEQLKQNFGEIDITAAINLKTKQIDYKALREIWEADKALPDNLRKIPQAYDSAIKSILDAGDKLSERQRERWGKDLERAREYADKRIELAQYTATQIAEIEAKRDSLDPESKNYAAQVAMYDKMISGYREREKNEAAKLDYEQIKEHIGMFDDLGVRIGTAFESILNGLREYTQSPDFARLGLEAQKNVYQQIAKIEDRMAEGFQGIGVGTVSEYVRQYSTAASEYLTAQNNLRDATLRAIEADKEWERVKNSSDEAAKAAALAEKQLADSRVRTAAASVNAAGANLQRAQEGAARASAKFDSNLQKVESSLKSLNNGALKALWDLIGDKGKRSVGEFLSGSRKILSALDKLTKALADSGSDMGQLSTTIATNLAAALQNINPDDTEAIARAATESLKTTLSSVISDKGVVDLLANTLSKNIGEIASQALGGVLSTEDAANKVGALIDGVADAASKTGEMWGAIISLVLSLLDEFAENGIGTFLGELLDNIADAVEGILANLLTDSLPKILGSVGNVVKGVGVGLADMLTFGAFDLTGAKRIKKANKEIKRQQKLLEQLEYTYGRLEKAADKVFGRDYVNNYNQQLKNLQAQQQAYLKQAEAERSKGKKKDEEKIKEYENAARETADKIKELQDDLVTHFTGSTKTDVARQMAKSWIDARASMSDTFAAIKGDYQDLIKNMIVEGAAARVIENALTPVWDSMQKMLDKNDVQGAIDSLVNGMDSALNAANNGMEVLWKALEARGYDMKKLIGDTDSEYTGIAKSVAGATSEEILQLSGFVNTALYHTAYLPKIYEELVAMRTASLPTATVSAASAGWTDWQQQAMDNYQAIARNTAETVVRCERAAIACEKMARVIKTKGATSGFNVFLNS